MCGYVAPLGRMLTECDLISTELKDQDREAAFAAINRTLSSAQQQAFDRLLAALRAYFEAHDSNEISVMPHFLFSGGWDGIHREREDAFLAALRAFEAGQVPQSTPADFAATEKALNAAYAKVIAAAPDAEANPTQGHQSGDAPTRASIRATERLWLIYRDAFATFATLRYPGTTRETWLTYVTKQRAADLSDPCFTDDGANC